MKRSGRILATAMLMLAVGLGGWGANTAAQTGSIALTVQCTGNPEQTTITNNTDADLPLGQFTLRSLFQPREGESYALGTTLRLAPGGRITFITGTGGTPSAETPRLTGQFIYEDNEPTEGARLTTPYGTLDVLCSTQSGSLAVNVQPPSPTPTPPTSTPVPPMPTPTPTIATTPMPTATVMPATAVPTATLPATPATAVPTATVVPTRAAPTATVAPTPTPATMPGLPNTGGGWGSMEGVMMALGALGGALAALGLAARRRRLG